MHAYTLWLCIFLFIIYYVYVLSLFKHTIKLLQNKKNLSNSFILLFDFWCWTAREDKDKEKEQQQQQMQGKRYSRYGKNNQLFN